MTVARKRRNTRIVVSLFFVMLCINSQLLAQACLRIGEHEKDRLADYVKEKFRLSSSTPVVLTHIARRPQTCLYDLHFETPHGDFIGDFVLSEDHRYLFEQAYDTRVNPVTEYEREDADNRHALAERDVPRLGPADAKYNLVFFADFECPYCKQAAAQLKNEVLPKANGSISVAFRHLPLQIPSHAWARHAAEAAACVYRQDTEAFWKLEDYLFENQDTISAERLDALVQSSLERLVPSLDQAKYKECLRNGIGAEIVSRDVAVAGSLSVTATPTFFLNGRRIEGLPSTDTLLAMLTAN
jgi:protein-disulfide isomerase